jgi:hypothetical protein
MFIGCKMTSSITKKKGIFLSKDLAIRQLRKENWELNNRLRAAEAKIVKLKYLEQTMKKRREGDLPSETQYECIKQLNGELMKRVRSLEYEKFLWQTNGQEERAKEIDQEGDEESDQLSDGLHVE